MESSNGCAKTIPLLSTLLTVLLRDDVQVITVTIPEELGQNKLKFVFMQRLLV
jgi:hypothetical protein